jgi:hypothetical protein
MIRPAAVLSTVWGLIYAQASAPTGTLDLGMPAGLLTGVTGAGILVWYLWYTVTRVLPEKDAKQDRLIGEIVAKHEGTISMLMAEFRSECKEQRAACSEELAKFERALARIEGHNARENPPNSG